MKTLNDFLEQYESFCYGELEDKYEEMLDELYEPVELAGMTIYASEMKNIDPIMFRCGVAEFSSEEYTEHEGEYYLNSDYDDATNEFEEYEAELDDEE